MQLSFTLTPGHLAEYAELASSRAFGHAVSRVSGLLTALIYGGIGMVGIVLWSAPSDPIGFRYMANLAFVVFVALVLYFLLVPRLLARRMFRPDGANLSVARLDCGSDGLVRCGPHSTVRFAWPAVEGVTRGRTIVVVWVDRCSGLVVPRSAFGDAKQEAAFMALVEGHVGSRPSTS